MKGNPSFGRRTVGRLLVLALFAASAALAQSTSQAELTAQTQRASQTQTFESAAGPVNFTPLIHASTLITAGSQVIYVDPAQLPSTAGLPSADMILITDIHPDHMDQTTISALSKPATLVWGPTAVANEAKTTTTISNGETKSWGKWTIEAIPMYNLTRPQPDKPLHPKGRGNGYVLTYGGKRFYFSGDTENIPEMRDLKSIDVAFVCMNLPSTMTPEEAAEAVKAFRPKVVIPYHYRSRVPNSGVDGFKKAMEGSGIEVRVLDWYPKSF
jgi:L-ascorbate metabolism protein UlaG (beta-lactamase superfamily)